MDITGLSLIMGHERRPIILDTYGDANTDAINVATVKFGDTFKSETSFGSEAVVYKKAEE